MTALVTAALHGQGLVLAPVPLVLPLLCAAPFVPLMPGWLGHGAHVFIHYPTACRHGFAPFVNFHLQQLRGHPDLADDVDTLIRGAFVIVYEHCPARVVQWCVSAVFRPLFIEPASSNLSQAAWRIGSCSKYFRIRSGWCSLTCSYPNCIRLPTICFSRWSVALRPLCSSRVVRRRSQLRREIASGVLL
jgi:hypothetical protein